MALSVRERIQRSRQPKHHDAEFMAVPELSDLVTILFATKLISQRIRPNHEEIRGVQDKVRQRIKYAINNRQLTLQPNACLCFGDLIAWAVTKKAWHSGLQGLHFHNSATAQLIAPAGRLQASGHSLPLTLDECHFRIKEMHGRILSLSQENERMNVELEVLRPIGIADKTSREKKSAAGKRGGRPPKR